jgi:hypothetical protein
MEVSGQLHTFAALPPVPIGWEGGWAPQLVWTQWRREKYLALTGNRTPAVQPMQRNGNLFVDSNQFCSSGKWSACTQINCSNLGRGRRDERPLELSICANRTRISVFTFCALRWSAESDYAARVFHDTRDTFFLLIYSDFRSFCLPHRSVQLNLMKQWRRGCQDWLQHSGISKLELLIPCIR